VYLVDIFRRFLGEYRKHNEEDHQISFDCPACAIDEGKPDGDGKGNLEINYTKGVYKCWKCKDTNNMHGYLDSLVYKYAPSTLIREYKIVKPQYEYNPKDKIARYVTELPAEFIELTGCNPRTYQYREAIEYLHERGITDDIIKDYNIGYCPSGKYHTRIVFPSYDKNGVINYWVARWFGKRKVKNKYQNPEADVELIIVNEHLICWDATIYLVEGFTDHIVTPNSIPLLGKTVHDILYLTLQTKAKGNVVIFLDDDAKKDSLKLYNKLDTGELAGRIRIVDTIKNEDPSSIKKKYGLKGLLLVMGRNRKLKFSEQIRA